MLKLTIWMNMPSFYQSDLFRSLQASSEVDLQVIFSKALTQDRTQLGWQSDLKGYSSYFLSDRRPIRDALRLARAQRDRIHIINGLWAEPSFAAALSFLTLSGSRCVVYSEAPEPDASRSTPKRILRHGFGRLIAQRIAGVLPISHLAEDFFSSLGVRKNRSYQFGYFESSARFAVHPVPEKDNGRIEVIFIGQLIHRKGIDVLLEAIAPLFAMHPGLLLTVIGGGDLLESLRQRAQELGVGQRVRFEGVVPIDEIPSRLAGSDLLVLPSRWDGWGLVVNEALAAGVPVIVSDRCGASDLIREGVNGYVFRSEDAANLRSCLNKFFSRSTEWPHLRAASLATAATISTEAVSPYLIKCLQHLTGATDAAPTPPWMEADVLAKVQPAP